MMIMADGILFATGVEFQEMTEFLVHHQDWTVKPVHPSVWSFPDVVPVLQATEEEQDRIFRGEAWEAVIAA